MNLFEKASAKLTAFTSILIFAFIFAACSDSSTGPDFDPGMAEASYAFNEGQLLGDVNTAYRGEHNRDLMSTIMIEENEDGTATITYTLNNTISGETYPVHGHDAADPATTPNGTPYIEAPNSELSTMITGNGGSVSSTIETETITYNELVNSYEGFYVVHDPTQEISTTDLTTYLILGVYGQSLQAGSPEQRSETFTYSFNEGQLLDNPDTAYEGEHPRNLSATVVVEEQLNGLATVMVTLNNTLDGQTYPVHSHDAADPATTPNGTPYDEAPNSQLSGMISGNGSDASTTFETSSITYMDLLNDYEGFFVVHDPTQDISTTDLTTYLILGLTTR